MNLKIDLHVRSKSPDDFWRYCHNLTATVRVMSYSESDGDSGSESDISLSDLEPGEEENEIGEYFSNNNSKWRLITKFKLL